MSERVAATMAALCLVVAGCGIRGPNEFTLPGGEALGSEGYVVTADFQTVNDLVPNSSVKYRDATIGTVTALRESGWHAVAEMRLKKSVDLPANVEMRIGQKSLLGAQFVEVVEPEVPSGRLGPGEHLGLNQTGAYPGTEEVLSAASLLLNNGGLSQMSTITGELDAAFGGREADARSLIEQTNVFLTTLNEQKEELIAALEYLDRIAEQFNDDRKVVVRGLQRIGPGLETLEDQRDDLVRTLDTVGEFSRVADRVIDRSGDDLTANVTALRPVLKELERAGTGLPESLLELTYPTPLQTTPVLFRGDYFNFFVTIDVSAESLATNLIGPDDLKKLSATSSTAGDRNLSKDSPAESLGDLLAPTRPSTTSTPPPAPRPPPHPVQAPDAEPKKCSLLPSLLGGC